MAQLRQQLAFAQETLARGRRIRGGADQLQRSPLRIRAVAALRRIDRAHAAAADRLDDPPRAQLTARHRLAVGTVAAFVQGLSPGCGIATEGLALAGVRRQHRAHFFKQVGIVAADLADPSFARIAIEVDQRIERRHRATLAFDRIRHGAVSFIRKARARRQSRRRVLSLMPSMPATSGSV